MFTLTRPAVVLTRAALIVERWTLTVEEGLLAARERLQETLSLPMSELVETAGLIGCITAPVWICLLVVATYA